MYNWTKSVIITRKKPFFHSSLSKQQQGLPFQDLRPFFFRPPPFAFVHTFYPLLLFFYPPHPDVRGTVTPPSSFSSYAPKRPSILLLLFLLHSGYIRLGPDSSSSPYGLRMFVHAMRWKGNTRAHIRHCIIGMGHDKKYGSLGHTMHT